MGMSFLAAAFLLSAPAVFGEYIYVRNATQWSTAQKYCRDNYVDLIPVISPKKAEKLLEGIQGDLWIGLYRRGKNWTWSGGTKATELPWASGRPDSTAGCGSVCWRQCPHHLTGLHGAQCRQHLPFLCYNLIVPQLRGTWEQAFAHCRKTHSDLASLQTKTEHVLAVKKIRVGFGQRVWIGLRFLADQWMWTDGKRLGFQAWNEKDEEHRCPALTRCGTLTTGGQWEGWNCMARLHFLCQ